MNKLSPQKEIIVQALRDAKGAWVCGRVWLDRIKDDRKRIGELNEGYMRDKGYEIVGESCKGSACGRRDCPLYKRRAVKTVVQSNHEAVNVAPQTPQERIKEGIRWFDNLPQTSPTA